MQAYIPCLFNMLFKFSQYCQFNPINQFQVLLTVSEACL